MSNYHIIPIKTMTPWLTDQRVFYFQLGKRRRHEAFIKKCYDEISGGANNNGLIFIFHKYLTENSDNLDNTLADYIFLKEVSIIDEVRFYDELECQIFTYQAIDPVYIVRKLNDTSLIAWGYDSFRKGKKGLQFPFESFHSLEHITVGEYCQLNPYLVENHSSRSVYR